MNGTSVVYRDPLNIAIAKNVISVVLSLAIIYINGTLVHTFRKHEVFFTNARYILYIHLVVNDIILLWLMILLQVLSYILFTLNLSFCLIMLMMAMVSSLNNPLTLAAMAIECYLAVCFPLHHPRICTVRKAYTAIAVIWFLSSLAVLPELFFAVASRPATFFLSRIFCMWANIFSEPQLEKKREVMNILYLVLVWLTLFYTYFRILFAAQAASSSTKKAKNTVLLHGFQLLLCMLSYVHNIMLEGLSALFPRDILALRYVLTLLIQVMPRLLNPIVYGLRDKTFRTHLKRCLLPDRKAPTIHPERKEKKRRSVHA